MDLMSTTFKIIKVCTIKTRKFCKRELNTKLAFIKTVQKKKINFSNHIIFQVCPIKSVNGYNLFFMELLFKCTGRHLNTGNTKAIKISLCTKFSVYKCINSLNWIQEFYQSKFFFF